MFKNFSQAPFDSLSVELSILPEHQSPFLCEALSNCLRYCCFFLFFVIFRDWFQLTLKEGLTVFREQSFMSDMTSPSVQRIEDVLNMMSIQFVEDDGPLGHPIRPDTYISVENLYTPTVYKKGAEVVRM